MLARGGLLTLDARNVKAEWREMCLMRKTVAANADTENQLTCSSASSKQAIDVEANLFISIEAASIS